MGGRGSKGSAAPPVVAAPEPQVAAMLANLAPAASASQSDVERHVAFLRGLVEDINNGQTQGIRERADAYLANLKGKELDALIKHTGTTVGHNTVAYKREALRERFVGRLLDSLAIRRSVYHSRKV